MRFTDRVREYHINLKNQPDTMWRKVVAREAETIRMMATEWREGVLPVGSLGEYLLSVLCRSNLYAKAPYLLRELSSMRKTSGVNFLEEMNLSYDIAAAGYMLSFGCTSSVVQGEYPIHIRTLDWALESIGPATRVFHFWNGNRVFVSVGFPGFVGALSGMVPGAYSVYINWLPSGSVKSGVSPLIALRTVLENIDTYEGAVSALAKVKLTCSVSFSVCGTAPHQMCVIERTPRSFAVRTDEITHANHFVSEKLRKGNRLLLDEDEDTMSLLEDSMTRREKLEKTICRRKRKMGISDAIALLDVVQKEDTAQKIAFCPATSEYIVLKRVS